MEGKNYNKIKKILTILCAVFLVFAIVACGYVFVASGDLLSAKVDACITIVEVILVLVYSLNKFKKDTNDVYRLIFGFSAFTYIVETLFCYFDGDVYSYYFSSPIEVVIQLILYGNMLLLAFGKDLGKRFSIVLASVNVAVYLVVGIIIFVAKYDTLTLVMYSEWTVLGIIYLLVVLGKYTDKELRGTK